MSTLIGIRHEQRHACHDDVHLPNCYNPGTGSTACECGARWWPGHVGVWRSRQLRAPGRHTSTGRYVSGPTVGWDRYYLHSASCESSDIAPPENHVCGDVPSGTYQEVHARG